MVIAIMNLPFKSPMGDTDEAAYLDPPSPELAIFGSFCLGLGDACYNTQIYSIIGSVFKVGFVKESVKNCLYLHFVSGSSHIQSVVIGVEY